MSKRAKRARYAAELAGEGNVVARAKEVRGVLADDRDAVIAEQRLHALAGPKTGLAAGRLVEREQGRRRRPCAAYPGVWKRLRRAL